MAMLVYRSAPSFQKDLTTILVKATTLNSTFGIFYPDTTRQPTKWSKKILYMYPIDFSKKKNYLEATSTHLIFNHHPIATFTLSNP